MTATAAGDAAQAVSEPADSSTTLRLRDLRPDRATWPLWMITAGMPLTFAIGMHGLAWPLLAVVLAGRIIAHRETIIPWAMIPLLLLVGWGLLSFAAAPSSSLPIFTYRWLLFLGAFVAAVWVANVPRSTISSKKIVDWLGWLWVWTILFGFVAQVLPHFTSASPTTILLGPLGRVDFVARISDWHLADNDEFLAASFARPAAPWSAANSWGAAIGILTPFFIQSWLLDPSKRRRRVGLAFLALATIPIVMSANRGLWIGLALGFVYFSARRALRGNVSAVVILVVGTLAVGVLLAATPLGNLVQSRFGGSDASNSTRSQLYVDAWEGAKESPLIGNGVPRDTNYSKHSPPVGTHGLLWYLMFIHGFVGLGFFLAWLGSEVAGSGTVRRSSGWAPHLSLVIAMIEVPFYGLLPHLIIVGVAAGLAHRERLQPVE